MSALSARRVAAYALPVMMVAAAAWWQAAGWSSTVAVVCAAAVAMWQWVLLRRHLRLARRVNRDPLTGLPNRASLVEQLQSVLSSSATTGLVFIDLDRFKGVNDSHGHLVGDLALVDIAHRLRRVGGRDAVVARYGGDEFALVVPGGEAEAVAQRVEACLRPPVRVGDVAVRLSASVGVAVASGRSVEDLMAAADAAMYEVKRGRSGIRTAVPNRETLLASP